MAIASADDSRATVHPERQWYIVGRWAQYEGEARANLLRIVAVGTFYGIELARHFGLHLGWLQLEGGGDPKLHVAITSICVAWALVALVTHLCLRERIFPGALQFLTTAADVALLTMVLQAGDGAGSSMVVGYFLIIALAALRFRLRLVWCAVLGSLASYLFLLGFAKWQAPPGRYPPVPRYEQMIMLAAIGLTGIILGQVIRGIRGMAADYARRLREPDQR